MGHSLLKGALYMLFYEATGIIIAKSIFLSEEIRVNPRCGLTTKRKVYISPNSCDFYLLIFGLYEGQKDKHCLHYIIQTL